MSIERNYEFKDENKLLYNIDNYDVNDGLAIDFNSSSATLRNINTNPKSHNFFGDGRLGSQTYISEKAISPTCCYFQSLVIDDPVYGTHLQGVFAETSVFNVGDEVILHKRFCVDKDLYDEVGKWDIVKIIGIIIDPDGVNRYVLDKAPNNDYNGDETVNTATAILQFSRLTIGDTLWLKPQNSDYDTRRGTSYNWRDSVRHPDQDTWGNRMLGNPRGILYIKVKNKMTMLEDSRIFNHVGTWGGQCHNSSPSWKLDESKVRHDYRVLSCGFLPSPSTGLSNVDDPIEASKLCDFVGHKGAGGGSFYSEGDYHDDYIYAGNKIDEKYKGENGDLDKIFYGMAGSFPKDNGDAWAFGGDGGGIIIIQAKEMEINEGAMITTPSLFRGSGNKNNRGGVGSGGTTIVKCPNITINSTKAFISSTVYSTTSSLLDRSEASITDAGIKNHGTSVLEFETVTINDTVAGFQDVQDNFDDYKDSLFYDFKYFRERPLNDDGEEIITAEILHRKENLANVVNDSTKVLAPTTSMAEYETGKYYKVYTKGLHNIDASLWNGINGFESEYDIPSDTDMRILFSRDGGDSWFKINIDDGTAAAVDLDDIGTDGNTFNDILTFQDTVALTGLMIAHNDSKHIDICVGMKTDKSYKTPILDNFLFNYSGIEVPKAPIRILPYHEEEFDKEEVDFVWMQPLQRAGSMQNRLEISSTANFEPTEDKLDIQLSDYSHTGGKLHLPYVSKEVDNMYNGMTNLVLPYMLTKVVKPESTYDENKTSCTLDADNSKIVYHGDTFFYKGDSYKIPAGEVTIPNLTDSAPLRSDSSDDDLIAGYKMSTNDSTGDFADSKGELEFDVDNVLIRDNTYLGKVAYFDGSSSCSHVVANADKKTHILTRLDADKTIHIKLNPKKVTTRSDILNIRKGTNSTETMILAMYPDHLRLNDANSYHGDPIKYLFPKGLEVAMEQNITIACDSNNRCDVYMNGYMLMNNVPNFIHPEYVDDGDDDDSNDNTDDLMITIGAPEPEASNYRFNGYIHELAVYDYKMDAEQVMAISKTPNFHMRYDMRDEELKLLQYPYSCTELMYDNELYNRVLYTESRQNNAFAPSMLINPENMGYDSNNETILLGKVYAKKYLKDSFRSVVSSKHHIPGYGWYTDWTNISNTNVIAINANNTVEQNYTSKNVYLTKTGRINKHTEAVELDFVHDLSHFDTSNTGSSYIGVRYGIFSTSSTGSYDYSFLVKRNTNMTYSLQVDIDVATYSIPIEKFEAGHRYTLSIVPIDGSFQEDVVVRLYSPTNSMYNNNPVLFSSAKSYGYSNVNKGFANASYDDHTKSDSNGDYVDVAVLLITRNREYSLIGMTCVDSSSEVTRDKGYITDYYIEKRLSAGLTNNIIRMDVVSEILSAHTYVRSIVSFDEGVTWKVYDNGTLEWTTLDDLEISTIQDKGMNDADLYAVTDSVAETGGFNNDTTSILRTYLLTDDVAITPSILQHKILKNGPRIIDSWQESGSYYRGEYAWHYLNDGSWNPYLPIDTSDDSDQNWEEFGIDVPSPTVFVDGHGSKPSTNLLKTYAHVKVDCLPKGKWYWRVSSYNGLKR